MKSFILIGAFIGMAAGAQAATVNTSNWSAEAAPSVNRLLPSNWVTSGTINAAQIQNGDGSLVSDFTVSGAYRYTLNLQPTKNLSSGQWVSDDDILGAIVGWNDKDNNIRIGFGAGGTYDHGLPQGDLTGFWIVEEKNGVSTVLFKDNNFSFNMEQTYALDINVNGNSLGFDFASNGASIFSGSVSGSAAIAGKVGVYTESQTAKFTDISVTMSAVPLPAGLPLMIAGLGAFGIVHRKKRG